MRYKTKKIVVSQLIAVFVFGLLAFSRLVVASDLITGSWHGEVKGKPAELSLWKTRHGVSPQFSQWGGILYIPHYDCFASLRLSYAVSHGYIKQARFEISFISDRYQKNNCKKNNGVASLSGSGNISYRSLPVTLKSAFVFNPGVFSNEPRKNVVLEFKRGTISQEMLDFIERFDGHNFFHPTPADLVILKTNSFVYASDELKDTALRPSSLNGYYQVSEEGGVGHLTGSNENIQIHQLLPSKLAVEMGVQPGDYTGKAVYRPQSGEFYHTPLLTAPSDNKNNCEEISVDSNSYVVTPVKVDKKTRMSSSLSIAPKSSRGTCQMFSISTLSCEVVQCLKFEYAKSVITKNKEKALALGKERQRETYQSYADRAKEMDDIFKQKQKSKKKEPGYYDRHGACGNISCSERDIQQEIDGLILEQYLRGK